MSCMIDKLELSPATSWSTGTLSSGAKIVRIAGSPMSAAVVSAVGARRVHDSCPPPAA